MHAVTLMSTHEHLVVTDTKGNLPDFLRRLHRLVALGTKVLRKWRTLRWPCGLRFFPRFWAFVRRRVSRSLFNAPRVWDNNPWRPRLRRSWAVPEEEAFIDNVRVAGDPAWPGE
jgi:hypothetical protein